jgi:tetratricopeptide (TPR) repeat protein
VASEHHPSTPLLRRLFAAALWSVPLTGAGLYLFARESMSPVVSMAVCWHILAGILLAVPFLWTLLRSGVSASIGLKTIVLTAVLTGFLLVGYAAAGHSVNRARWLFLLHLLSGFTLLLWFSASALRRLEWRTIFHVRKASRSVTTAALLLLGSCAVFGAYTYSAEAYYRMLTATTPEQAGYPHFPAGTIFAEGGEWETLPSPESCGEEGCHPDVTRQWSGSGHAQSEESPFYQRALAMAKRQLGESGAQWCQGCHAPFSLHPSARASQGDPAEALKRRHESGKASVNCLACHAMTHVPEPTGNGRAVYSAPPVYPLAQSRHPAMRWTHRFLLRVRPAPHQAALKTPTSPYQCVSCHRLSVNMPQNRYKFLRYDETWGDWLNSPYSGYAIPSFDTDSAPKDCAACHLPKTEGYDISGRVRDHALFGADTAKPVLRGDRERLRAVEKALQQNAFRLEIISLRRLDASPRESETLLMPLVGRDIGVRPGEEVSVDVLAENIGIGHAFPTGLPDLREAWIAFTVTDSQGRVRLVSDKQEGTGLSADADVHWYGMLALNRLGQATTRGNFYEMVALLHSRAILPGEGEVSRYRALRPGEGDVARYRFRIPKGAAGSLRLNARLIYRPFRSSFLQAMFGEREGDELYKKLPTTILAEHSVSLRVQERSRQAGAPIFPPADPKREASRLLNYAIALLLQNDLTLARRVLQRALHLDPDRPACHVALGRAFLAEGDLLAARSQFQKALRLDSSSDAAKAWLGYTHRRMGQFETALAYLNPLSARYPRDRMIWFNIGRSHFQTGSYEEAAKAFRRMLDADPDDVAAHFNLMDCYRRLRRLSEARREEAAYRVLRDDELPTHIIEPFLREHPHIQRERLLMHEHLLSEKP